MKNKFNDSDRKPEVDRRAPRISNEIAKWIKSKTLGYRAFQDGKNWWWCPHHKWEEYELDGLYVTHPPEGHEAWKLNKHRRGKRDPIPRTPATSTNVEDKKIILGEKLKAALMTKAGFTKEESVAFYADLDF